ncbi:putative hexokinase hkdc1 [Saguinus oedipus]|uniref:Phosphotransferase n=1 Tax=Saguinus oedipus TaxID=9490 RepID=A0ABQ9UN95_SAGOE|nr:putative hexokinase hkdc1 [Saguinus oedipus]
MACFKISKILSQVLHSACELTQEGKKGEFLSLDLGGSKFRVLKVQVAEEGKRHVQMESQFYPTPSEVIRGNGTELFEYVADCLADFMKTKGLKHKKLPLGLTFSFPCRQTKLEETGPEIFSQGVLISWTKKFKARGVQDTDVVSRLTTAMRRHKDMDVDILALVNDTVGTMMTCAYDDPHCEVGVIIERFVSFHPYLTGDFLTIDSIQNCKR